MTMTVEAAAVVAVVVAVAVDGTAEGKEQRRMMAAETVGEVADAAVETTAVCTT